MGLSVAVGSLCPAGPPQSQPACSATGRCCLHGPTSRPAACGSGAGWREPPASDPETAKVLRDLEYFQRTGEPPPDDRGMWKRLFHFFRSLGWREWLELLTVSMLLGGGIVAWVWFVERLGARTRHRPP